MISVVVPSVRSDTVTDTIAAILEQTDPILDQSADPRIRRVVCPGRGASPARNFGVLHAGGDLIAFTDDDCRPRQDWIAAIREIFQDPQIWMATGSLVRAGFAWQGYFRVLKNYTADQELRLLVPRGTSLQQLYEDIPALLGYRLPSRPNAAGPARMAEEN